jgi:hypothetical protein
MTKNMGPADRAVRVLAALVILGLYVAGAISGLTATVLGIIAVVFVVTSAVGFCPAYVPFKISTLKKR